VRIFTVEIAGARLLLTYDDYPVMIALESDDDLGDRTVKALYERLRHS